MGERVAQQSQAEENLERIEKRVLIDIDKVYRKLDRTKQMMDVARESLSLCRENTRLSENSLKVGAVTTAKYAETLATLKKAEMQDLAASLDYRLTLAELEKQSDRLRQLPSKIMSNEECRKKQSTISTHTS